MATFPSIKPTYGIQKRSAPRFNEIQFGDGYSTRVTFGLNQNPKEFSLTYEVSETQASEIETFLDARANDSASFDFAEGFLPEENASSFKFVCKQWTKSIPFLNRARIQVTFEEVFQA